MAELVGGPMNKRARHQAKLRAKLRAKEKFAAAYSGEIEYVGLLGIYEVWRRGSAIFALRPIQEGDSAELAAAVRIRNQATLSGACPECGAVMTLSGVLAATMNHEADCPASDDNLLAASTQ